MGTGAKILGPVVVGMVAERFGYGAAFAMTGAVMAVAVLVWAVVSTKGEVHV